MVEPAVAHSYWRVRVTDGPFLRIKTNQYDTSKKKLKQKL